MRKILYSTMVIFLLMALTGLPAYGYGGGGGGGGGGGEGEGDPTSGMGPSTSVSSNANSNPPAGFDPAPPPGPFDPNNNNPFEVHWNFETDNGTYQGKSPEQLQEEREQVEWIKEMVVVVGGSVILGYATGGYSIYVQVASSSIWSGGTAYYYAKDDKMQSSAESAVQDGIIAGANPLGPVGNAVVSPIITEIREQIPARPYQTPRERLEYIADPRPRPLH